jgi:hypothetical protein
MLAEQKNTKLILNLINDLRVKSMNWEKVSTLTPEVTNSHNSLLEPSRRQTNDYTCEISSLTIKHRTNCSRHVKDQVVGNDVQMLAEQK